MQSKVGNIACDGCRQKKRKCTFERPSCHLCRQNKSPCVYSRVRRKPGPELGSKRVRNQDLFSRITTLETLLKNTNSLAAGFDEPVVPVLSPSAIEAQRQASCEVPRLSTENEQEILHIDSQGDDFSVETVSSHVAGSESQGTIDLPSLNESTVNHLFALYFDHIQPAFPLFRRPAFYKDYSQGLLPSQLVAVMFALAARFSVQAQVSRIRDIETWTNLLACSNLTLLPTPPDTVDLNMVKTRCLTSIFEYAQSPSLKAWMEAGNMTRAAIGLGLHTIERLGRANNFTEAELEERRFVWWTIWKLDCCFNGIALTPLGTDDLIMKTYLVSTTPEAFTRGEISTCSRSLPDTGLLGIESCFQQMCLDINVDVGRVYLCTNALLRVTHTLRCRLAIQSNTRYDEKLEKIDSICSRFRQSFPKWFFDPSRNIERGESPSEHRDRLGGLLEFNLCRINSRLPESRTCDEPPERIDAGRWQQCVELAKENAAVINHWDVSYDTQVNPMAACIMWYTSLILAVRAMSSDTGIAPPEAERMQLERQVDTVVSTLRRLSAWWNICQQFSNSLELLRPWMWFKVNSGGIRTFVEQLQILLDPTSAEPASVPLNFLDGLL